MIKLKFNKPNAKRLFAGIAIVLVFVAGVTIGTALEQRRENLNLANFWQVYDLVKSNYVGNVDPNKAVEGATKGLVESLGDPFSAYLSSSEKQSLDQELSGQFEGIGAELTLKDGLITVVSPLVGSPAEKAGLKAKDILLKINDESTDNMDLDTAVGKIRGKKGSTVKLTLARAGVDKPIDLTITRDNIQVKSVEWKMIGNVGYISMNQFGDDTVNLADAAVKDLITKNPKAIILDLRNNPGGYLYDVPPIAGLFLPPSVVVKEKYKDGKEDQLSSSDVPLVPNLPMYVLVNGGSASAAEILSGALQDYGRAKLIGEKTFGKGSVQIIKDLSGGSALRITIAEWLTPKDRAINKIGIEPDIKVIDQKTDSSDPVLSKALDLVNR